MIEISNLTKIYKSSNIKAVDNLSLTVNAGRDIRIFGPNGAGEIHHHKVFDGYFTFH